MNLKMMMARTNAAGITIAAKIPWMPDPDFDWLIDVSYLVLMIVCLIFRFLIRGTILMKRDNNQNLTFIKLLWEEREVLPGGDSNC